MEQTRINPDLIIKRDCIIYDLDVKITQRGKTIAKIFVEFPNQTNTIDNKKFKTELKYNLFVELAKASIGAYHQAITFQDIQMHLPVNCNIEYIDNKILKISPSTQDYEEEDETVYEADHEYGSDIERCQKLSGFVQIPNGSS